MTHAVRAEVDTFRLQRANSFGVEQAFRLLVAVPGVRSADLPRDEKDGRAHPARAQDRPRVSVEAGVAVVERDDQRFVREVASRDRRDSRATARS